MNMELTTQTRQGDVPMNTRDANKKSAAHSAERRCSAIDFIPAVPVPYFFLLGLVSRVVRSANSLAAG